jgi:hypothetical protein
MRAVRSSPCFEAGGMEATRVDLEDKEVWELEAAAEAFLECTEEVWATPGGRGRVGVGAKLISVQVKRDRLLAKRTCHRRGSENI